MADDTRRPEDDETPVDPPTGETEVGGADWLISQLDAAPTGQFDTRQAPTQGVDAAQRPGRAGDNPVLAWWRDKLIAADALVNPEARPAPVDSNVEESSGLTDVRDAPSTADRDEDSSVTGPVLPEPAQFERRPAGSGPTGAPSAPSAEPEDVFLPEPAFTPAWTPVRPSADRVAGNDTAGNDTAGNDTAGNDTESIDELRDEAETGLIPSAEPPLFQPRSARDRLAEEQGQPAVPVVPPADDESDETVPTPAFPAVPGRGEAGAPEPARELDTASGYVTEDLDNFSWKLTANDRLDPRVHRPGDDDISDVEVDDAGARHRARSDAGQGSPAAPVVIPTPGSGEYGPRRSTFAVPVGEPATVIPPSSKPELTPLRPARPAAARAPRPVLLAAIGVVALLVLGGLFFLGSQLPGLLAGPAAPTASPTATPTPTAPAAPVGPAAAGEQQWTALGGGECVEPYSTPWAETFTVVDCGEPHAAQMVFTGPVAEDSDAAYPGEDEILSKIYRWCTAPGVFDADAASEYPDLQVQGTYPVSEQQWVDGQRNFSCFVNRSSGEPLTGSLAEPRG